MQLFTSDFSYDATREDGSHGRLVNDDHIHPKTRMKLLTVDDEPRLCLFVIVDKICKGEEITYDYGPGEHLWRVCIIMCH